MRKWWFGAACVALVLVVVALILTNRRAPVVPTDDQVTTAKRPSDYITSAGCRECHADQYDSWHDSYHRTMTQEASVKSVVAPIDDITLQSRGRSYRFYKQGEQIRVKMVDPTWETQRRLKGLPVDGIANPPLIDQQIVMTTGSHHHQVYWIKGGGNELRQVPFVYHIATKQWIPNEDSFLQPTSHERQSQRWNDNCIICHTVGGRPGFELIESSTHQNEGRFNTKFIELGISCEACHGPGGRHAKAHRQKTATVRESDLKLNDPTIVNPARLDTRRSAAVCGQCHAHYYPHEKADWIKNGYAESFRPGELLDESRVIIRYNDALKYAQDIARSDGQDPDLDPDTNSFWNDGTHRVGGREYNGLIESSCYQNGKMTCLSCHSMHNYREPNDQLNNNQQRNDACLQCHGDYAEKITEHTHHAAGSTGSECYNCHMPHTTYALFKGIRSHQVDSPKSETFLKSDRPNACNLCHLDQTLQWTVDSLHKWYDQPRLKADKDNQTIAASILWMLKGDAAQRAIAVWSAGWKPARDASGGDWATPYVAELLTDPYAAIRFMAARTLEKSHARLDPKFNFVGPEKERIRQQTRVVDAWKQAPRKKQPDRHSRLLFDLKGLPIRRELDRLIRLRSNKRISISE